MIQLYATKQNSTADDSIFSAWKHECSIVLLCLCMMGGTAMAQQTKPNKETEPVSTASATIAGLAQYTSGVSGSASCSGDTFTLTLANVSDNSGRANKIGSVILKLPAGLQLQDITSKAVSDGWTFVEGYSGEIRLKAKDDLSNAVSRDISATSDNLLKIDLKVNVAVAKSVVWQTSVFTSTNWTTTNNGTDLQFQLVTIEGGVRVVSSAYPGLTINPLPVVTLSSSDADNSICAGDKVTFTAGVSNGVAVSSYEFFLNGVSVKAGPSNTYEVVLKDGDKVGVKATSDKGCSASGNEIVTKVNPLPVVVLSSSDADNIVCEGETVTFTAGVSNGVLIGQYEFLVDGVSEQKGPGATFSKVFSKSQKVQVIATSAASCSASSATMAIQVKPLPVISLSSSDADNSICAGEELTFTASVTNGVVAIAYEFFINGELAQKTSSNQFKARLTDKQQVSVQAICETGCSALSNTITTTVNALPVVTLNSSDADNTVCEGEQVTFTAGVSNEVAMGSYEFFLDGKSAQIGTSAIFRVVLGHSQKVRVVATSAYGCTDSSEEIVTTVNTKPVLGSFSFSIASAPVVAPLLEVNTALTMEIPLAGSNPDEYTYTLSGYGKTIPLQPQFDGKVLTFTHLFSADQAGIYELEAYAKNMCGEDKETYQYIRVYNPNGGFITGGGTIHSKVDARYAYMNVSGKANYGFVAKYKDGAKVGGHITFNFHNGNMNFKSASLDEMGLIVAGKVASFTGKGTINGAGTYGFMLAAVDGLSNADDKARMIIWEVNADGTKGKVVYDNQGGAGEHVPASQLIDGGSIVIHGAEIAEESAAGQSQEVALMEETTAQVVAYPNPFQDKLTIDMSRLAAEDVTITLVDASGLVVYQKKFDASSLMSLVEINLSNVRSGMYFLQTKQGKEMVTTKLYKF